MLQVISNEIETKRNSPQEPWTGLRDLAVANCTIRQPGLLRDVVDFCFAVFDCLEPNVSREVRGQRIVHVGALAMPLNLRIGGAGRRLTACEAKGMV